MLRTLYIRHYALIEEFTVEFGPGLNIITGETGAGKSIVLDAFSLLIGERASIEAVRKGKEKAIVEAEFDCTTLKDLKRFLSQNDYDVDRDTLTIRREVSAKGGSRGFINDTPATSSLLKQVGEYLVDLHGQHEHQALLHAERHIDYLDQFAGLGDEVAAYRKLREEHTSILRSVERLKAERAKAQEERDYLEFQLKEILQIDPSPNEDDEIEKELLVLENAEELKSSVSEMHSLLYNSEGSVLENLVDLRHRLDKLSRLDKELEAFMLEINSAHAILTEVSSALSKYARRVDLDPRRLDQLRTRLQGIVKLKKKFGGTLSAVIERRETLQQRLEAEGAIEDSLEELETRSASIEAELKALATAMSAKRTKAGKILEKAIGPVLRDLGIEKAQYAVAVTTSSQLSARGSDHVEFLISMNAGEDLKPLAAVASGGEVSRVMLSLKSALAKSDPVPLLIFDEIDAGISGRVAQRVGRAMKLLSKDHQILSITHLPQIAAFADRHYLVEKSVKHGITSSQLVSLASADHEKEVARLMAGSDLSKGSVDAASQLIAEASRLATDGL